MGVPATTFKGSLGNFEKVKSDKSDMKQCSAAQKYTTLDMKIYITEMLVTLDMKIYVNI